MQSAESESSSDEGKESKSQHFIAYTVCYIQSVANIFECIGHKYFYFWFGDDQYFDDE